MITQEMFLRAAVVLMFCLAPVSATADPPRGSDTPVDHDITRADVVNRTILAVMENYYDLGRVDSMAMFEAAMDSIQLMVPEVRVVLDKMKGTATVEVIDRKLEIELDAVKSPWGLSRAIKKVFVFLKKELPDTERDWLTLEYVVVNAILSVLDPHTSAMMPDQWAELRMAIRGEFEGVGIRITTDRRPPCNGDLTVVEVFDDTPAMRAGLRKGDKILEIDGESTVNITTSEAADRLRGTPGTSVKVSVRRADGSRKELEMSRGKIPIESVKWEMLEGNVGYISLDSFSDNSGSEVEAALQVLRTKKMKGLIFDVRGNPGGSLPVAIEIADLFLDSGTIVTTAGRTDEEREVANAESKGTEPDYPLVLLIDSGSASAAEILAGALRNHGRSLLVGRTTFGKGSVQRLMSLPAGGALRITTAQYLTPGDISIQAVGVAPDVKLVPVIIDRKDLNLDDSAPRFSEADLDAHLSRPNERVRGDRPGALKQQAFVPPAERKTDMQRFERCYLDSPREEMFLGRREKEFARLLVADSEGVTTPELLLSARSILGESSATEDEEISRALRKLGVDWSAPPELENRPGSESPSVTALASLRGKVIPGKDIKIRTTVKNGSTSTIYRLRGVTESDNPMFDKRELVFGKVAPGKSKTWEAQLEIPRVVSARIDPVTIKFVSEGGPVPPPVEIDVKVPDQPRSRLGYSWHMEDLGNGNGYWEPGEEILMRVELTNIGERKTFDFDANLSAKPGVNIIKGHFEVKPLAPGKSASGEFRLRISEEFFLDETRLTLSAEEWIPSRYPITMSLLSREIELPVTAASPRPSGASGAVTVTADGGALLQADPSGAGREVARAPLGSSFPVDGRLGKFFRVRLGKDMHAWLRESDTRPGGEGKVMYEAAMTRPPSINIEGDRARTTDEEKIQLNGWVEHRGGIKDVLIFVGDKKVAYLPNRDKGSTRMGFSLEIPLKEGANQVMVVARHDDKNADTDWLFVRRVVK